MSVKTKILDDGKGVEILATKAVYGREIISALHYISPLENIKYHIINKEDCTEYYVTADDMSAIAKIDAEISKINPDIILAIIESKYLNFSLTQLWQDHVENFIFQTKSFTERPSAISWIKENIK